MMHKKISILAVEHPLEKRVFAVLFAVLALFILVYLYFVAASILNVIARRDALAHTSAIQGTIGSLERQYYALSEGITPDIGGALGLSPVAKTSYVYRPGNVGVAILPGDEI